MTRCISQHVGSCSLPRPSDPRHLQTHVRGLPSAAGAPARTIEQGRRHSHAVRAPAQLSRHVHCRSQAVSAPAETARRFPDFVPAAQIAEVEELAALELASRLERLPVSVLSLGRSVDTAFVAPASSSRIPAGVPFHVQVKRAAIRVMGFRQPSRDVFQASAQNSLAKHLLLLIRCT